MKLVYIATGEEVKVGDRVEVNGIKCRVHSFSEPRDFDDKNNHKCHIKEARRIPPPRERSLYVTSIGAHWVKGDNKS